MISSWNRENRVNLLLFLQVIASLTDTMTSEQEYSDNGFANHEGELINGDEVADLDGNAGKAHTCHLC